MNIMVRHNTFLGWGILTLFLLTATTTAFAGKTPDRIGFIKVAEDNWNFVDSTTGRFFVPIGCNYYDSTTGWAPNPWSRFNEEKVETDFAQMKDLGVNTARIAILTGRPWVIVSHDGQYEVNAQTLENLQKVLAIAKKYNIRLILSQFYWEGYQRSLGNMYTSEDAIRYQEFCYRLLAREVKDEPIVFAHTLANEPRGVRYSDNIMEQWNDWLRKKYETTAALKKSWTDLKADEEIGNIHTPESSYSDNSQRLYDFQLFRESISRNWIERMVKAIRSEDTNHLVSLGNVQWALPLDSDGSPRHYTGFDPRLIGDLLDFVCIHYYPFSPFHKHKLSFDPNEETLTQWIDSAEAFVRYSYIGKPVILEEYNFGMTPRGDQINDPAVAELLARYNKAIIERTRTCASGWLSWPYQDTRSSRDISNAGGLVYPDGKIKPWGREFTALAASLTSQKLKRIDGSVTMTVNKKQMLTSEKAIRDFWNSYHRLRRQPVTIDFQLNAN